MATLQRIVDLAFALLWIGNVMSGAPDLTETYVACNIYTYQAGDPFAYSLAYVVSALETVTPNRPGYDYYITSPYPTVVVYGHTACNPALSIPDCISIM
ncbi:hypothetical protein EUGRSUZ_L00883 [Eucalyptus grandis]|uniref:Gnk2-homologous domain-containing protein n=1 Tax=Eucalyptus grandis TaxID=71139 RepID=A0A058ZVP8_EUCGR|nr:hypothetical protein EUGRSUZ_L00883 [Eucalyptus grandis]